MSGKLAAAPVTGADAARARADHALTAAPILEALDGIILGKSRELRLALACLLARGHLLIEDLPGVGKTTLAHALARVLGLGFQRIQFTSDLLPADILGVSVYHPERRGFEFQPGPIFAQLVLADEINRATPKTQSALLEAMEEQQVTADGVTHPLPEPFFVVATRNPTEQTGTFALPESQLDRFLMQIRLGYPDPAQERALLTGTDRRSLINQQPATIDPEGLRALQQAVPAVHVSEALLDYLQALIAHSRDSRDYVAGLSPRGGLGLLRAAQAWALLHGHAGVHPDDLQAVLPAVVSHRLVARAGTGEVDPGRALIEAVPVP
ncbi:MAG: AAA family ATPase [Gammaproteobacteria bacterium]|nr:MAG: AAA family ATPase [Gammaproteobacteria bacterium]